MGKNYDFEYIIIGSGPAGRTIATKLATAKKSVAVVECENFGGAEINTRDYPYEIALNFAHTYHDFIKSPAVNDNSCHFNYPTFLSHMEQLITRARSDIVESLQSQNIKLISGFAHFLDSNTIAVDEHQYTAKYFILATGSVLKAAEISGLDNIKYLDPETALFTHRLPKFVFIVGGGPTGVQLAEYFAMLGTGVIIMERGTHLLPREDEEVANAITDYFTSELGITVVTNSRVTALTEDYSSKIVVFSNGSSEKMVRVDSIILSTGSEPYLDYGLENAGVDYKRTGINVDKYFNTSAKNIFAIGDCVKDADSSTEHAILEANTLAANLLHRQKLSAHYNGLSRYVNIKQSVATIGMNERDILSRDLKCRKSLVYLRDIPSLHAPEYKYGFIKLLTDHSGKLLGASIVAPNADLLIGELSMAMRNRLSIESLASTSHPASSPALAITAAARKLLTK